MFYEVRVLNAQKALKKIISSKELSLKYWNEFEEKQEEIVSKENKKNQRLFRIYNMDYRKQWWIIKCHTYDYFSITQYKVKRLMISFRNMFSSLFCLIANLTFPE